MVSSLKIAKLLSIFYSMSDIYRDKNGIISFKQQLRNEALRGAVTVTEEKIVLKLMGIEKANTIKSSECARLNNILNIVEYCSTMNLDKSSLYNYINGEFKLGRINQENKELLLETFNTTARDAKMAKEPERRPETRYLTLEQIKKCCYIVTVYDKNNFGWNEEKVFDPTCVNFEFMLQDREVLKAIKDGHYTISGVDGFTVDRQMIDVENTPLSVGRTRKRISAKIDPQEIIQAEQVMQYVDKYNSKLWLTSQSKNNSSKVNIDENKIAVAKKTGNIFSLFKR